MKLVMSCLLLAAVSSVSLAFLSPVAGEPQQASEPGRQLFEHNVSMYAIDRAPGDGAPGASAIGFRISNDVQGSAIIVRLDQPTLGVFVGLNAPDRHINEPYKDLHVVFTLADGSTRMVKPGAGGGVAMLFQSPQDVPMTSLLKVALYVDQSAKWAQ
ncbi:MAG: hypothetical protein ACT4PU_11545 [Planctomycetota bacterium]